jgi:hypothetical protein
MTTYTFYSGRLALRLTLQRLMLTFLAGIFASTAFAEMSTLEEVILDLKEECAGYIQDGTFKGTDVSNYSLDDDFFLVGDGAVESFLISRMGRVAHLFSRHEALCADSSMNEYCGSSGCEYSLIINDNVFALRGRFVEVVESSVGPVLLVGRAGANCGPYSNAAPCVQAHVWDEDNQSLNRMGN